MGPCRIAMKGQKDKGGTEKVLFVVMAVIPFVPFELRGSQVTS